MKVKKLGKVIDELMGGSADPTKVVMVAKLKDGSLMVEKKEAEVLDIVGVNPRNFEWVLIISAGGKKKEVRGE